jgi:hypothetical protein
MSQPRGLFIQHHVFDLFRGARCRITYDAYRDKFDSTDMVLHSIPIREFQTSLEIETTCVDDPSKFKYFLGCTRKIWARFRRKNRRPARLYIAFDDIGARGIVLTHAAFDAVYGKFVHRDPAPGWIYVLLVGNTGACTWVADPFAYLKELEKRHRRELSSEDRLGGRVESVNGSSFVIRGGEGDGTLFFAFYDRKRVRPNRGDKVTFLPIGRRKHGIEIVRAVHIEQRG